MSFMNFSKWWAEAAEKAGVDDQGEGKYTIDYGNDVGPHDDYFIEWWKILSPSGKIVCKCEEESFAIMICALLNEQISSQSMRKRD